MGDRGGISLHGCKWHSRQQGEGVCAICLRKSLEKLATDRGEYPGALSSNYVGEFSRERNSSAHSSHTAFPSVSYRTRSRKEPKPKGVSTSRDGSMSDSSKPKDATSSKDELSWGFVVHRIASLRSAFTSLWKSDKQTQVKWKQIIGVRDKLHCKPNSQIGTDVERKEKLYEQQYVENCETGRVNRHSNHTSASSSKTIPWTASSFAVPKFTHRSSSPADSKTQWRRSRSSREARLEPHVDIPTNHGSRSDGVFPCDAPSPIQPVPLSSIKSSSWRFFSRSGSRRSPHGGFKVGTPVTTPRISTASNSRQHPVIDSTSSPMPRDFSLMPDCTNSIFKSTMSSPSMVKRSPPFHISLGSKSTSSSRTLSPSTKPSPLYQAARTGDKGHYQGS